MVMKLSLTNPYDEHIKTAFSSNQNNEYYKKYIITNNTQIT